MNLKSELSKYKLIYDHHTHTDHTHGKGSIEENVRVAFEKGLRSVAITDHGPGNFSYGLKLDDIPKMRTEIEEAKKKYPGIVVFLGVEANTLLKPPYIDVPKESCFKPDILLCGYHFAVKGAGMVPNWMYSHYGAAKTMIDKVGKSLLIRNTDMIINCLYYNEERGHHIDILTHPGDKGPFDIEDIARVCQDTGTLMEINGKHPHLTVDEIKIAAKYDVKFIISSDAHVSSNVGTFAPQLERALEAGVEPERIVNIEKV